MNKEMDYFSIDGVQGGSQDWMSNLLMKFARRCTEKINGAVVCGTCICETD